MKFQMLGGVRWLASAAICLLLTQCFGRAVQAAWSEPRKLSPNVNGVATNHFPFISADAQRLYLAARDVASPYGSNEDIYLCSWDSTLADWGPRQLLGPEINTIQRELSPCESPDRQYLWFISYQGGYDLFFSIWDTANAKWGPAVNAGPQFNSTCIEWSVSISPDGRRMFLVHGKRPGIESCEGEVLWISYWSESQRWWDTLIWMGDVLNRAIGNLSASMSLDTSLIYLGSQMNWPGTVEYGEGDIFEVRNETFQWDSIANAGMPPNSADRDEYISISADGQRLYFSSYRDTLKGTPDIYVTERSVSVEDDEKGVQPETFYLSPAWPNPFNAETEFSVSMFGAARLIVAVYDILGRKVATLQDGAVAPGARRIVWAAGDSPSGVYFLVARTGSEMRVRKALLLK